LDVKDLYALKSQEKAREYHKIIQNTKSARTSNNFDINEYLQKDKVGRGNKVNVIYEEETSPGKLKSTLKADGSGSKPPLSHRATASMPKLPSNPLIYNNYNIINNYQNIILPTKEQIKKPLSGTGTKNEYAKYVRNYTKDLDKIRQNVKRILNEYNFAVTTRSKEKDKERVSNPPLTARTEGIKGKVGKVVEKDMELLTDRNKITSKKLISQILSTNNAESKAVTSRNIEKGKMGYMTTSVHATISHNSSQNNINKKTANAFTKHATGKIFHYQDQVLKSHNISPEVSKTTITSKFPSKKPSDNCISRKDSCGTNLPNKSNHIVIAKKGGVSPLLMNNYLTAKAGETKNDYSRKMNEVKPLLKIKNFFEINKLGNELRAANTERQNTKPSSTSRKDR